MKEKLVQALTPHLEQNVHPEMVRAGQHASLAISIADLVLEILQVAAQVAPAVVDIVNSVHSAEHPQS
jgi:hypothetical protein